MSEPNAGQAEQQPGLKRVMGPGLLLLFIVGDILGTGVYALTGSVAGEVGGAAWLPFMIAFAIALVTAFAYLELVTKYPQAAGAALYTHKAFGIHFITFLVCYTVMCSGITSASTASQAFANFLVEGFGFDTIGENGILLIALGFMVLIALVNLRGVGESVKANVVLTMIELSGLLLVILVGLWAMAQGEADFSRVVAFETSEDKSVFLAVTAATSLAFFAMVGFEDSVNMAEETKDPSRTFPKIMLTGLSITGVIYVLVSISAVAIVPVGELEEAGSTALTLVVERGAPDIPIDQIFPFIGMFAVANSALINMLMASRLLYGMANQAVLPPFLGKVHQGRRTPYASILFTTALALGLIIYVTKGNQDIVAVLGGTTALLLLGVFAVVNVAVLVLRRDSVDHHHFRAPSVLPIIGVITCAFFVTPYTDRNTDEYEVAGVLLAVGIVLWVITWFANRAIRAQRTYVKDPTEL